MAKHVQLRLGVATLVALVLAGAATAALQPRARLLRSSEVPRLVKLEPIKQTTIAAKVVVGLDPLFHPKAAAGVIAKGGFRVGVEQDLQGVGHWKDVGGYDAALEFSSPDGAIATVDFFHTRSLGFCLRACDLRIVEMHVPRIPGALGTHRYRLNKTKLGPAFDLYFVFFRVGNWAYGVSLGGPPGTITPGEVTSAALALYRRA